VRGTAKVYVRLAMPWADPSGTVHGAGEFVDVDVVTLAELEEQGVVENAGEEFEETEFVGPGESEDESQQFVGPGESDDDVVEGDEE
jgi:hypothetical protein